MNPNLYYIGRVHCICPQFCISNLFSTEQFITKALLPLPVLNTIFPYKVFFVEYHIYIYLNHCVLIDNDISHCSSVYISCYLEWMKGFKY